MSATKQSKAKKTASLKKPLSHPPFAEMITDAIVSLKERTGSSQYAITKFIEEKHHKELPQTFRKLILHQLKKSVAAGKLVKVKNSFKLAATRPAPAKATTAAPATATTKKPKAAASKPATKKPAASSKPKPKAAAKQTTAAKPKPKPKAKPAKATAGKKVAAAKPARKTPVKSVKKPKSVKSPAKKAKK